MKKFFAFMLCLMLMLAFSSAAFAATQILDEADLFSSMEEAHLNDLIASFQQETGMDFVILTTSVNHGSSQAEVADEIYDRGGYGLGENQSGILYYIDMYERIPYLSTAGEMIDYMTDERITAAHDATYSALGSGQYAAAAEGMIASVQAYVRKGIPEGQFQYDVITGQMLTARHKALTSSEMLVCALVGLVVAMLFIKTVEGRYNLKGSTYEYSFRENCAVNMTDTDDTYLRTTTTRTRKAEPPSDSGSSSGGFGSRSGGSSVHRSSSGRSHGGGAGRRF